MHQLFYPAYGWPYAFRYGQISHAPGYYPYASLPFYPPFPSSPCGGYQSNVMQWPGYGAPYTLPYTGMSSPMLPPEYQGYQPQQPMTENNPAWESPESPESPWLRAYQNHVKKNKKEEEK